MEKCDAVIIGAGVIGLSLAYRLRRLGSRLIVVEKNDAFGQETSSRNSEVIHSGLYYLPGSLKAQTCIEGRRLLYDFCHKHHIGHKKLGKLVVALSSCEEEKIEAIYENARNCGLDNLSFLGADGLASLVPQITARRALYCPDSGIVDSHGLMDFFYQAARASGVIFSFSTEVTAIKGGDHHYELRVREPAGQEFSFEASRLINCAGCNSDKVASLAGVNDYKLHYCKGQYFRINNPAKFSLGQLVYPPPTSIDLGIHITPDLGGGLRLGPDAKYVSDIDYKVDPQDSVYFYESVRRFLPSLEASDLIPDTAGIRPKLQAEDEGFRDFVICHEEPRGRAGLVNLVGIESPGLTACLSIARLVEKFLY